MSNGHRNARRLYAVIPAGGSGTRLWPASRASRPKFLLPLPGPATMIQATVERLLPIVPSERMLIITGSAHAVSVARQLPSIPEANIIVEPAARGTGPAIGLGAALIARNDPDAIMGSFAADHYVERPDTFRRAVEVAADVALDGYLVTIGITPSYPETGYGYIRAGRTLREIDGLTVSEVETFREKPDEATARAFVESGEYLWNASMFVWRAGTLLDEMERLPPGAYAILMEIATAWDTPTRAATMERCWPQLRDVTIDHGIMEHADRVAVVAADIGWSDIGDWHSLGALMANGIDDQNVAIGSRHIAEDTHSTFVVGQGRTIATLGVTNLVVVDTDDVLLICDRTRAQDVKRIVEQLKGDGDEGLI